MIDVEKAAQASLAKDEYLVAVKLLLRKGNNLLIVHDKFGQWICPADGYAVTNLAHL